jgi:hypothetical protein
MRLFLNMCQTTLFNSVSVVVLQELVNQFYKLFGWFATVWEIWKERNNRLFTYKSCSVLQMVDNFTWLVT